MNKGKETIMNEHNEQAQNGAAGASAGGPTKAEKKKWSCPFSSCDLSSLKGKMMFVAGGAILIFLLILFFGYRIVLEETRLAAEARLAEPKYKYEFSFDGGPIGKPSSSFVDLRLEGGDTPLELEAPATIELSWTIRPEMQDKNCAVYGRGSDGEFFEFPVAEDGGLVLSNVDFSELREEGEIDIYSLGCLFEGPAGMMIEEVDEVHVYLKKKGEGSATSTESSVDDEGAAADEEIEEE